MSWTFFKYFKTLTEDEKPSDIASPVSEDLSKITIEKTPEDRLAESLEEVRKAIRAKAAKELTEHQNQLYEANSKMTAATHLGEKLGLINSTINIVEKTKYWPSWSKHEKFNFEDECLVDGLKYLGGSSIPGKDGCSINELEFQELKYRITIKNTQYGFESSYMYSHYDVEVFGSNQYELVFAIDVYNRGETEWSPWLVDKVTALKLGDWVSPYIILDELLIAKRQRKNTQIEAERAVEKARNL